VLAPFALLVRIGSDPLAIKRHARRGWQRRLPSRGTVLDRARAQF
jgi:hypothetical protein